MLRVVRRTLVAVLGLGLAIATFTPAAAQQTGLLRQLITTPNADYTGFDYETIRNTTQDACEAACLGDNRCRAFTFNTDANWCFLKNDFGALSHANAAVAGRIVNLSQPVESLERIRVAELDFLSADLIDRARAFTASLDTVFLPGTRSYGDLIRAGGTAASANDNLLASSLFGAALSLADEDPKAWLEFGRANLARAGQTFDERQQIRDRATSAAINAYLRSEDDAARASALLLLTDALEQRQIWRPAIKALRAAIALRPNADLQQRLDTMVAQHGFRIVTHTVDSDSDAPRICVVFSDPIPVSRPGLADYVTAEGGPGLAIEPESTQICVDGVRHGSRYRIQIRAGLPAVDGEVLATTAVIDVFVPDRSAWVGFAGTAYVLPAGPQPTIPIQSINAPEAEVQIYRIGDRSLAFALREGIFLSQLEPYRAQDIAYTYGALIWEGALEIDVETNQMITTAIPVEDALGEQQPGVYVITARVPGALQDDYWDPVATQWFVISDLGISTLSANDGIHAVIRSLSTAQPEAGITVRLVARNNEVLGEAVTDAEGHVRFDAGLARGAGGNAPQVVIAETAEGDYAFLDLTRSAFDLTDRGVAGRPAPGAIDAYMRTERGVYRPGETVHVTALVRDSRARAVAGLPMTLVIERPDGVEQSRVVLNDEVLGGYHYALDLSAGAMRGSWRLRLYSDPDGAPVEEESFLVEDFEPERLAFDLSTTATAFDLFGPTDIDVAARYLYGATAPDLTVTGDIAVRPVRSLAAFPGYQFGREDDPFERIVEPIDAAPQTDAEGNAVVTVYLPAVQSTTLLLQGEAVMRLTDTSGRAVERRLVLPVTPDGPRIGVRPTFDYGVPEGGPAQFDVIAIGPDFARTDLDDVEWTLLRVETDYQWYSSSGVWRWRAITRTQRVGSGTIDLSATGNPARITAPVEWGEYRLELTSMGSSPTSTTVEFYAGWYVANAGTDTPDVLQVALDRPSYALGETANLRLDPQFAGVAMIAVVDDRLIHMEMVDVPAEGTTVPLTITEEWGPGAYITATLFRPMDLDAGRMPARALGLTWAEVEPGDRDLSVTIDVPEEVRPRGPLTIPVTIDNLAPGTEAYVAIAAVDLGILNLTNYQPPAPDAWYFGQRQLGTEIRDLYGNLIDTTQGQLGRLRVGGDGGAVRLGAPPPTTKLVAFHSGVVRVDENGEATVEFEVPDFNGTVRIMVQAWSAEGIGSAVKDVFVRDPVVVATTVPRFLNLGDVSRLLIEVNNVSGPAGDYRLTVEGTDEFGFPNRVTEFAFPLAVAGRTTIILPISADIIGDGEFRVNLTMPDGEVLPKDFQLGVRAPGVPETQRNIVTIPAQGGTLTVDGTAFGRFVPGTAELTLSVGSTARLDVAGVLNALDRYPYGCVEQTASRAMPLLYLNEVAASIGIAADTGVDDRIRRAVASVLEKQASSGAFGLWGPYDDGDLWLDAYVTDFLTRARENGFEVPERAFSIALDNLSNSIAYAPDFASGGQEIAYALYVLARNGRASIGDLRYYLEAKLTAFSSPLSRAQLGAALALYGDMPRAERAFASATAAFPRTGDTQTERRTDYGTTLRDMAAVLALAVEAGVSNVDTRDLTVRIAEYRDARRWTSTQEDAWTLMAAAALIAKANDAGLTIDGEAIDGPLFRSYYDTDLAVTSATVTNTGPEAVDAAVTVTGVPVTPAAEGGYGFTIERRYFRPDGTEVDVSTVAQNERFVVTLTVTETQVPWRTGRVLIVDPLPAGFEIENSNLSLSGDVSRYPWLSAEAYIEHAESRTDRYVASLNRYSSSPTQYTVAYTVRAVSPGNFVHPAAVVEDMYRPDLRANTATTTVEVVGPTQ
ncbi:MAG: alpha-2-macroglobulin family protein [Bauldia sp.]|nr:alpha-2-macroglobulin family protein [Bauldia sp.]